ncbi:hypothetical protein TYRP_008478 [Tyrophagus putrescentiae]|nr:hypothetical protein TYRP_008478 [Tyrophagus putrescentiae]
MPTFYQGDLQLGNLFFLVNRASVFQDDHEQLAFMQCARMLSLHNPHVITARTQIIAIIRDLICQLRIRPVQEEKSESILQNKEEAMMAAATNYMQTLQMIEAFPSVLPTCQTMYVWHCKHPYFQARDGLCQFSQSWSRFEAFQQQMDELKKQLKGHLQSLVNRYLRFVRQGTRPRRYPDDLNPENPFFRLDGMFDQKNANKKDEILAPTMGNQRRHIRSVIRIKEALVALLWVIYEDACKWFCKEHDAKTGNIYAWAQMQPMLKTANDFLGNVQQMTNAMHRCIDKAGRC